jgi:hypothetical protein
LGVTRDHSDTFGTHRNRHTFPWAKLRTAFCS